MDVLSEFPQSLSFLYHGETAAVLRSLQLSSHLLWGVALVLLITKLAWSPLDKATTYGKLLFKRSTSKSSSTSKSGSDSAPVATNSSPASTSRDTQIGLFHWLNMRFAFTSSYVLGFIWVLVLLLSFLTLMLVLHETSPIPASNPCQTLPISEHHANRTLINSVSAVSSFRDKDQSPKADSESSTDSSSQASPLQQDLGYSSLQLSQYFTSDLWYQSFCSMSLSWCKGSRSLLAFFSERTAVDLTLYVLSNSAIFRALVLSSVLLFHLARRSLECFFLHIFSPRPISFHNLLLMWAYYATVPFVLLIDLFVQAVDGTMHPGRYSYDIANIVIMSVGVELFLLGSVLQFYAHRTLAAGRNPSNVKSTYDYFVPKGGLFDYVSCPHYLAELIIYIAFTLIAGFTQGSLLVLLFDALTMGSQALKTHAWYRATFTSRQLGDRKALIPFVL